MCGNDDCFCINDPTEGYYSLRLDRRTGAFFSVVTALFFCGLNPAFAQVPPQIPPQIQPQIQVPGLVPGQTAAPFIPGPVPGGQGFEVPGSARLLEAAPEPPPDIPMVPDDVTDKIRELGLKRVLLEAYGELKAPIQNACGKDGPAPDEICAPFKRPDREQTKSLNPGTTNPVATTVLPPVPVSSAPVNPLPPSPINEGQSRSVVPPQPVDRTYTVERIGGSSLKALIATDGEAAVLYQSGDTLPGGEKIVSIGTKPFMVVVRGVDGRTRNYALAGHRAIVSKPATPVLQGSLVPGGGVPTRVAAP